MNAMWPSDLMLHKSAPTSRNAAKRHARGARR
jgi:hypothetical protein